MDINISIDADGGAVLRISAEDVPTAAALLKATADRLHYEIGMRQKEHKEEIDHMHSDLSSVLKAAELLRTADNRREQPEDATRYVDTGFELGRARN